MGLIRKPVIRKADGTWVEKRLEVGFKKEGSKGTQSVANIGCLKGFGFRRRGYLHVQLEDSVDGVND